LGEKMEHEENEENEENEGEELYFYLWLNRYD
jgi:hypothetical protein